MGKGSQWDLRPGKIALLVILLILVPSQSVGTYNTFSKEYDFIFPKDDVIYQPRHGTTNTQSYISLPSMDIIGANVRLNELNILTVQMIFEGKPYTNITTVYNFGVTFYINSTNKIDIGIINSSSTTNGIYTSINQSVVYIRLYDGEYQHQLKNFKVNISPTISSDAITWKIDLNEYTAPYVPLAKIFVQTGFSNQTQISSQTDVSFYFGVKNSDYAGYMMYIHNEYTINYVKTSPNKPNYFLFWGGIGLFAVLVFLLFIVRKRSNEKLMQEKFKESMNTGKEILYPNQGKKKS